ncbi:hypothetical protein SS50377_23843 [Spironucleus salmonicida]|uniref:Uncharacterized protein n=1 Tax=Spironucleus salmonicida TaxID=348837 RepID=V6LHU7_9EUKA|nr:hypothetical protein SS50377_23843 [Spironucleus salmonicida]|eukprot:EST44145.1 hypothetical protein SS50377_16046 [Spironucleus salmonicida]
MQTLTKSQRTMLHQNTLNKSSPLYQQRIRGPMQTLPNLMPTTYSDHSLNFQKHAQILTQIKDRLDQRVYDETSLQSRMADQDTIQALEAGEFFREMAQVSQNAQNQLQAEIQQLDTTQTLSQAKQKYAEKQLEIVGEQFGNFDADQLIAQINRIEKQVQDSQLLATELGYPSPQLPDALETITQSALETMKNEVIIIDGVEKPAKTISFQLLLAELQTLKSQNFLMRQAISENMKQKAQTINSETHEQSLTEIAISESKNVTESHNPVQVYQQEFKGSGVQACKALIELRDRTASLLVREQRFNNNSLLKREACDNETLRTLVCGLQNELQIQKEAVEKVMQFGVEIDNQSEIQLSDEMVQKLANCALNGQIQVDLLPNQLARKIDFLVNQVAISAENAVNAKFQAGKANISVSELQKILEKRNETVKKLNEMTTQIIQYLKDRKLDPDQAIMTYFKQNNIEWNGENIEISAQNSTLHASEDFARVAFEEAKFQSAEFAKLTFSISEHILEIQQNLNAGNREKFQSDGQGFIDVLEKMNFLLKHCRELHFQISKRDFTIQKLQNIVVQGQFEKQQLIQQSIDLAAVRNGLVYSYLELRKQFQNVSFENQTIKSTSQNPMNMALTSFKTNAMAQALQVESTNYTTAVSGLASCIQLEVTDFARKLDNLSGLVNGSIKYYKDVVENRDQKCVQTDRGRKVMDMGLQVQIVEVVDPKAKKK